MLRMSSYSRGDVVLVGFVFSDESGSKLRPAVVVSGAGYHRARQEMVVAAIEASRTALSVYPEARLAVRI